MAYYEYRCKNENCEKYEVVETIEIPMSEYSADKLPKCEMCGEQTYKVFSLGGHGTFHQGWNNNSSSSSKTM